MGGRLRVLDDRGAEGLRGPHADIWRTVSAWIWAAYLAGIAAAISLLLL